jgi:hypothetical protein
MATRDITTSIRNEIALNVAAITSNTTTNGNIIPVADFESGVNFTIFSGDYTDGTYDVLVEHGNDSGLSDAAAVADTELLGEDPASSTAPEAQAQISAANKIKKIGYVGAKAFVRISIVSTSVTTGATLGAIVEKKPEIMPAEVVA